MASSSAQITAAAMGYQLKNLRSRSSSRRWNSSSDGRTWRGGRCSMTNSVWSLGSRSPSTQAVSRSGEARSLPVSLLIVGPLQLADLFRSVRKKRMLVTPAPTAASVMARSGLWSRLHSTAISSEMRHVHDHRRQQAPAQGRRDGADDHPDEQDVLQYDHRSSTSHSSFEIRDRLHLHGGDQMAGHRAGEPQKDKDQQGLCRRTGTSRAGAPARSARRRCPGSPPPPRRASG